MNKKNILDVDDLRDEDIRTVFARAAEFKRSGIPHRPQYQNRCVALLFLEDSTRTRMSFETACQRLGVRTSFLEEAGSSITKGETWLDTFLNISAMRPELIVIRFGEDAELEGALKKSTVPVISAGQGKTSHVTQALLDAFTLQENFGKIEGLKLVIVGDIKHSRVAASNLRLLARLGAKLAVCGPQEFVDGIDEIQKNVEVFNDLNEAVKSADAVMALRVQMERLPQSLRANFSPAEFVAKFGIRKSHLQLFKQNSILMHPGPVNVDVELDRESMSHPRSRILQQTEHGVYIRAALVERMLDEGFSSTR